MRKVSQNAINAFLNASKFGESNTSVIVEPNVTILVLFGNKIAYRYNDPEKTLSITTCGYNTNVTIEKLNALPNVRVNRSKGNLYLNGVIWDGSLVDVLNDGSFVASK